MAFHHENQDFQVLHHLNHLGSQWDRLEGGSRDRWRQAERRGRSEHRLAGTDIRPLGNCSFICRRSVTSHRQCQRRGQFCDPAQGTRSGPLPDSPTRPRSAPSHVTHGCASGGRQRMFVLPTSVLQNFLLFTNIFKWDSLT